MNDGDDMIRSPFIKIHMHDGMRSILFVNEGIAYAYLCIHVLVKYLAP